MARTRILLSLDPEDYRRLKKQAAVERLLPATLAARIIEDWLSGRSPEAGSSESSHPERALMEWLAPHIDEVRERGGWPENVAVSLFNLIERDAHKLYDAAEAEIGTTTLNQAIGRMIRTRLGAEVVRRNGRPVISRVPAGRTSLIKTVTLLRPAPPANLAKHESAEA
jgi:hypothetical protein